MEMVPMAGIELATFALRTKYSAKKVIFKQWIAIL
jgi:hypothetical protein